MRRIFQTLCVGCAILLVTAGSLYAHKTIQRGPQLPTATGQLQSDFGRDHVDLEPTIMGVRLTTAGLNYIARLINDVLQDPQLKLLEYVDCMVKGMLDADTADGNDEVEWNLDTDSCDDGDNTTPGYEGPRYDPGILIEPTCLSIPIVGNVCLMLKVIDEPVETGDEIIEWHTNTPDVLHPGDDFPRLEFEPNTRENKIVRYTGESDPAHDTDDALDLKIYIADITLDTVFTYPTTATDYDVTGYPPVTSDTCSSTLEDGPECLGDATCGEMDVWDAYDPATDISTYPTVWAKLVIGCYDGPTAGLDPAEQIAEELCPNTQAPLILSTIIRAGLSYDDDTHINYSAEDGSADSGAFCDPDRDPDNDFGLNGCHLKTLDVNIAGLDLYANVYFKFDRNDNDICGTCPDVFGDRDGDGLTEFTPPSACCGAVGNDCSGLTAEQKEFCDRNTNDLCRDEYDDPNYNPTQNIGGLLPFMDAQLMAKLQDVFTCDCVYGTFPGGDDGDICSPDANECINPATGQSRAGAAGCGDEDYPANDPGCVGYYLASTLRINLSPMLDTISFDHPLTEDTDHIYFDAGVRTDMWADSVGVLLPGDLGIDFYYTYNAGTPTAPNLEPMTSCVTIQVDGPPPQYVGPITPVVSQVCYDTRYYNLPGYTCAVTEMTTGVEGNDVVLNSDQATVEFKPYKGFAVAMTTGTYTYHVGLGIHHNFFSRMLTSVINSGALCLTINGNTPTIGEFVTDILNTGTFGLLMPKLSEIYGDDNDMEIRLVPSFKRPEPADYQEFSPSTTGPLTPFSDKIGDIPFILTGGYSIAVLNPNYPDFPNAVTTDTADLTVGIPHLRLDFHVVSDAGQADRVFGLDFGMLLGVDLELLRDDDEFQLRNFPGDITLTTGRIIHAGISLSSAVNYYLEYYEALSGLGRQDLNSILSNLIPTILSMAIGLTADIGFDLGAVLPVPLTVRTVEDGVCTGPNQAVNPGQTCPAASILPSGPQRAFMPGSTISWNTPLYMLSGANAGTIIIRATDFNLINPSDWLGIFLRLEGRLNALAVIELLEGGLLGGLGDLGLSPSIGWDGFNPPETRLIPAEKLTAMDAGFTFDAYDDIDTGDTVRYAWRLDKGFWTPFTNIRNISFTHLYEGNHILEVRAVDSHKNMDPTPAVYTFRIDSLGPSIRIHGAGDMNIVATSSPTFYIEAKDAQAPDELVTVSYRVDGSDWTPFASVRTITLSGLEEGLHRLEVRAKDDLGNISTASMVFKVSSSSAGFGCSTVKSTGIGFAIILLFVPLLLRRR